MARSYKQLYGEIADLRTQLREAQAGVNEAQAKALDLYQKRAQAAERDVEEKGALVNWWRTGIKLANKAAQLGLCTCRRGGGSCAAHDVTQVTWRMLRLAPTEKEALE